jgi:hypothetical protein
MHARGRRSPLDCLFVTDLQHLVALSSDRLELHANAPVLILEMQSLLGAIASEATEGTARGRRPFRADAQWEPSLAALAYALFNLADQTGVNLEAAVRERVASLEQSEAVPLQSALQRVDKWPFSAE